MTLIESVMKESACCATQASLFTRLSGVFFFYARRGCFERD